MIIQICILFVWCVYVFNSLIVIQLQCVYTYFIVCITFCVCVGDGNTLIEIIKMKTYTRGVGVRVITKKQDVCDEENIKMNNKMKNKNTIM